MKADRKTDTCECANTVVIGVTGCIGSGKSTVTEILQEMGAHILDADEISKRITMPGNAAYYEIIQAFGDRFLDLWGRIKRDKLAAMVFSDEEKLAVLNEITHRHITQEILDKVGQFRSGSHGVMVLDVPLPVKHGFLDTVDAVWVVTADTETRVKRIEARSGYSREEAIRRMEAQLSNEEYLALADEIIDNSGTKEELRSTVGALAADKLNKYLKKQ